MALPFKCSNCGNGIREIVGICDKCKDEEE